MSPKFIVVPYILFACLCITFAYLYVIFSEPAFHLFVIYTFLSRIHKKLLTIFPPKEGNWVTSEKGVHLFTTYSFVKWWTIAFLVLQKGGIGPTAGPALPATLVSCRHTAACKQKNPCLLALHLTLFHWWHAAPVLPGLVLRMVTEPLFLIPLFPFPFPSSPLSLTHTLCIKPIWMQGRSVPLGAETLPQAFCPARLETVSSWECCKFHFVPWKLEQPEREPELTWSQGLNWSGSLWRTLTSCHSLAGRKYFLPHPSPHSHTPQPRSSVAYHPNKVCIKLPASIHLNSVFLFPDTSKYHRHYEQSHLISFTHATNFY